MKLGVATIQRNRSKYLAEWLCFHYLVGFRKFYLYLHRCTDDSLAIATTYSKHFDINVVVVPDDLPMAQLHAYKHAYECYNHEVDWMAFIDGDEFLYSPEVFDIGSALEPHFYKRTSALCAYWACFGSSGHVEDPNGLVLDQYKYRASLNSDINRHLKSIVKGRQASLVEISQNPHIFFTPYGSYDENERLIIHASPEWDPTHRTLRINHYATQSREFFETHKRFAGTAMDDAQVQERHEDWWMKYNINDHYDDGMSLYLPELNRLMASL